MEKDKEKICGELGTRAREIEIKFNFFLVALNFAILGLGIKTAKFGFNLAIDIFEIMAWISLFSSGLIGLKMIEIAFKKLDAFRMLMEVMDNDEKKEESKKRFAKTDKMIQRELKLIKYRNKLFIIGIILIAISRMALPLKNIICRFC